MRLTEDLLASLPPGDDAAAGVRVGLHWTAVQSRFTGMAHTYKTSRKVELSGAGELEGRPARELAARLRSWEPLEASLGLAAANALLEPRGERASVNEEILRRAEGARVTVIGRFPFNDRVRRCAGEAWFLETEPAPGELPSFAAEEVLPMSDVAVITATALINHSLARLLALAENAWAVVLGPSTPLNDVLFDHGADALAGVRVTDPSALFASLVQGVKTFRRLRGIEPLVRFRG